MAERGAPIPIVIDTDGGVDDAVALWWALSDPRVDVVAILVTWGNVDRDIAATTVFRVLAAAGRPDIPVALGADDPIGRTPLTARGTYVHGEDGLGGYGHRWSTGGLVPVAETAAELLSRVSVERPGELVLLTVGPMSTVGAALRDEPEIAARLRSLVVMGGAVARGGNALPAGEANVAHDPEAAAIVLGAGWPEPPLLVGLDATLDALLHHDDIALAAEGRTVAGTFLADPLVFYADFYTRSEQVADGRFACHDLLAALAVVEPEVLTRVRLMPLAVDTGGSVAWGSTIADRRAQVDGSAVGFHPCRVALAADEARFRAAFRTMVGGSGVA